MDFQKTIDEPKFTCKPDLFVTSLIPEAERGTRHKLNGLNGVKHSRPVIKDAYEPAQVSALFSDV